MTLANKITLGRFLLSLACFGVLVPARSPADHALLATGAVLFLVVAFSDMLDGYAARKYGEVTEVGRIADPIVDKIAVCGCLILTQQVREVAELVPTWVVVVVVVREFVVSGIRAAAEARGIPFPANVWGKLKSFAQNVLVGAALIYPAWAIGPAWTAWFVRISGWAAALLTVVSGVLYASEARRVFRHGRKP